MNIEFEKLYNDWYANTSFLSVGNFNHESWFNLVDWSKKHIKEAIEGVRELIADEPNQVIHLLDEIIENAPKAVGFVPLDAWCNLWIAIIDASEEGNTDVDFSEVKDNYEDSRAYHDYLKDHYIPWNCFKEDDPNITLEEFRQGKRNDENLLKERLKDISQ